MAIDASRRSQETFGAVLVFGSLDRGYELWILFNTRHFNIAWKTEASCRVKVALSHCMKRMKMCLVEHSSIHLLASCASIDFFPLSLINPTRSKALPFNKDSSVPSYHLHALILCQVRKVYARVATERSTMVIDAHSLGHLVG